MSLYGKSSGVHKNLQGNFTLLMKQYWYYISSRLLWKNFVTEDRQGINIRARIAQGNSFFKYK